MVIERSRAHLRAVRVAAVVSSVQFQKFRLFGKLCKSLVFRLASVTTYSERYCAKFLLDSVGGKLQIEAPFAEFEVTSKPCGYPNRECSTNSKPPQLRD